MKSSFVVLLGLRLGLLSGTRHPLNPRYRRPSYYWQKGPANGTGVILRGVWHPINPTFQIRWVPSENHCKQQLLLPFEVGSCCSLLLCGIVGYIGYILAKVLNAIGVSIHTASITVHIIIKFVGQNSIGSLADAIFFSKIQYFAFEKTIKHSIRTRYVDTRFIWSH